MILVFISRLQVQQGNLGVGTKPRSDLKDVLRDKEHVCSAGTRGLSPQTAESVWVFLFFPVSTAHRRLWLLSQCRWMEAEPFERTCIKH